MTISAALIRRMIPHGIESQELAKVAYFIESFPNGRSMIEAVLDGIEANPSLEADYFRRVIASLRELPEHKDPANDRTPRMSSQQRKAKYEELIERDGRGCAECGCGEAPIWRRQGVWSNDFGRYTKVHPTPNLEVDHRTPLWAGGDNNLDNLWLLCIDCHKQKTAEEAGRRRRA